MPHTQNISIWWKYVLCKPILWLHYFFWKILKFFYTGWQNQRENDMIIDINQNKNSIFCTKRCKLFIHMFDQTMMNKQVMVNQNEIISLKNSIKQLCAF